MKTLHTTLSTALIALAALSYTAPILADTWLNVGGVSKHFKATEKFNEVNQGFGIEKDVDGLTYAAGIYANSINRSSRYATVEKKLLTKGDFSIGLLAGVVDGYYTNNGNIVPVVLPVARWDGDVLGARLIFLPAIDASIAPAVALQLRIKISK